MVGLAPHLSDPGRPPPLSLRAGGDVVQRHQMLPHVNRLSLPWAPTREKKGLLAGPHAFSGGCLPTRSIWRSPSHLGPKLGPAHFSVALSSCRTPLLQVLAFPLLLVCYQSCRDRFSSAFGFYVLFARASGALVRPCEALRCQGARCSAQLRGRGRGKARSRSGCRVSTLALRLSRCGSPAFSLLPRWETSTTT